MLDRVSMPDAYVLTTTLTDLAAQMRTARAVPARAVASVQSYHLTDHARSRILRLIPRVIANTGEGTHA